MKTTRSTTEVRPLRTGTQTGRSQFLGLALEAVSVQRHGFDQDCKRIAQLDKLTRGLVNKVFESTIGLPEKEVQLLEEFARRLFSAEDSLGLMALDIIRNVIFLLRDQGDMLKSELALVKKLFDLCLESLHAYIVESAAKRREL